MKLKWFLSVLFAFFAIGGTAASAQDLPGAHSERCLSELSSSGANTYVVFDGSWSGLEQTALLPAAVLERQPLEESVQVFAATPGKADWGVSAGCTVYEADFDGETLTVTSGQRTGESITYRMLVNGGLRGDLSSPGIVNFSDMVRDPTTIQVGG